jgi:hypothetical protein
MTPGAATYDHATAVADILAGYHRTEMAAYRDRIAPERQRRQDGRAREETRFAREAAGVDPERPI